VVIAKRTEHGRVGYVEWLVGISDRMDEIISLPPMTTITEYISIVLRGNSIICNN
jgi:hypothetical protein